MNHPTTNDGPRFLQPTASAPRSLPDFTVRAESRLALPGATTRGRIRRWSLVALSIGLLGCGWAGVAQYRRVRAEAVRNETVRDLPLRLVSRVDFDTNVTAGGRVESHQKTVVTCQIERMSLSVAGQSISANGATQILEVIEEGKQVKKGDILCRLNSTDYEELVRTQQIRTEQATAALEQAQLSFDVAELAVGEYREGLKAQNTQVLEGQIALNRSDLERATDRLRWVKDMLVKGYVPVAQRAIAERSVAELRLKLQTNRFELDNFNGYGNPRTLKELLSEVEKRRYEVTANQQRVTRFEERLAHYRKMVDFCTIRAPRDGMVIYATNPWRRNAPRLEPGVEVYQQQDLFFLPDLGDMEVVTYLHESVAQKVSVGLNSHVKIEGLGNQTLTGRVVSIGALPVSSPTWTTSEEVKYFLATIKLDQNPAGLLPGMSAEVEIDLDGSRDVLAVPTEAVAFEQGHDICYVAGSDGLERRQVTVGRSNRDHLEVTGGLVEGEEVVINPDKVEAIDSLLTHTETTHEAPASPSADPGGFSGGPVGVE